jgi:hypothetical protein
MILLYLIGRCELLMEYGYQSFESWWKGPVGVWGGERGTWGSVGQGRGWKLHSCTSEPFTFMMTLPALVSRPLHSLPAAGLPGFSHPVTTRPAPKSRLPSSNLRPPGSRPAELGRSGARNLSHTNTDDSQVCLNRA